jgi:hypothetical protein
MVSALRIIVAAHDDLTTACAHGCAAAAKYGATAQVQWGAVTFAIEPQMSLEDAHAAFFEAAAAARRARDRAVEGGL